MSAPPDFMTQLLQGNNPYGTNGALYSPQMGLALGLLQAGGPSRMPVSLGQALGQGIGTAQQFQGAGLQNAMQQLMLGKTAFQLGAMTSPDDVFSQSKLPPQTAMANTSATNGLMTPQTPTPTSNAIDVLASGQATPQQAQQISQTPLATQAATQSDGSNAMGVNPQALFARGYQYFRAGLPGGVEAMNAAASMDPSLQAQLAQVKAEAEFPTKARESLLSQMGRVTSVNPGEGQVAQSGLSLAPPQLLNALLGGGGLNMGGGSTVPPISSAPSGTNMSGIPTVPVGVGPNGGVNSQNAVYSTNLQKQLADTDAKYIETLQTNADSASQGKQNIDEMWQAYQSGLPTGSLSSFKVDLQKGMQALGVPMNDDTLKQITNYEAFSKNQAQLGISLAKSVSQRPSQFEFKYLNSTAVANPKLQGTSIPILLSQMEGTQSYAQQKALFVNNMAHQGINPRTAALQYDTNASIMPYALQALATKDPASYMKLKQEMQNTPSGRAFMAEIEKKAAWMQKNGGL